LRHQPTPREQLVCGDAMPTSHQAYRVVVTVQTALL
jgi:hypothetical protein